MRLIDADELLSYVDRVKNCGLGKKKSLEYITKYINNMPTAFDVDKVIEQIKNLKYEVNETYHIGEAIEIVKAGGIDEFNKKN